MEVTKSVYQLLQEVRVELTKNPLQKSGYNAFAKFKYFELKDFLPKANELFNEKGLCPVFSIDVDQNGIEYASLVITNGIQNIVFRTPTAEATNSQNPIQNLGSKHTYLKRYLYMNALELAENDVVDALAPVEEKPKDLATPLQVSRLFDNREKLVEEFKNLGIKTKNDIKALTLDQADELLEKLGE